MITFISIWKGFLTLVGGRKGAQWVGLALASILALLWLYDEIGDIRETKLRLESERATTTDLVEDKESDNEIDLVPDGGLVDFLGEWVR
jgi:hypothetical protein